MPISLKTARYLSLATFRKTGATVATPVWFAERGGALYVFSANDAGKVKRLRNSSRSRVAPCDMRGGLLGEWQDAKAILVSDKIEIRSAHLALCEKYGWQMHTLDFFSRLGGKINQREFIRIELKNY